MFPAAIQWTTWPAFYYFIGHATALAACKENVTSEIASSNIYGKGEPKQGWTTSPSGRGTTDIVWSSVFTSFLCCWSTLCINVAGRQDTQWTVLKRKCLLATLTLFAPEVMCVTALAQYVSASRSVKEFSAAGISDWTMRNAFVADMGGFLLLSRDWVPFSINAKQLFWLIQHGYLAVPTAEVKSIQDKNKVDGFMRLVMAMQTIWFCVNIVGRLAQGLAVTAIEVTTVAFIYCGLITMFLWRHKPADVGTPETLHTSATMAEILIAGGYVAREPYRQTPLDFVGYDEWAWSRYLAHLRHTFPDRIGSGRVPSDHISSMTTPEIPFWMFRIGTLATMGYCCIFVPAWKSSFPTSIEQLLWRAATGCCLATLVAGSLLTDWIFYLWPVINRRWMAAGNEHGQPHSPDQNQGCHKRPERRTIWDRIRNNSPTKDPRLTIPLKAIIPFWVLTLLYAICRTYILVEDFLELRSLPLSAFESVEWSEVLPHFD